MVAGTGETTLPKVRNQRTVSARPRTRRETWGVPLVLGAVGATAVATLTPADLQTPLSGPWCIVCGQHGSIDVVQNVLLFVPLGIGLAWAGISRRTTVVAAFAFTLAIEWLQLVVVPGRDGAVGDVVMNTLGAVLGFGLASTDFRLIRPASSLAFRQYLGVLTVWVIVVVLTILSLRPYIPPGPFALVVPVRDSNHFEGTLQSAELNGLPVLPTAALDSGDPAIERLRSGISIIRMTVIPAGPTPHYLTIARLASLRGTAFGFGQHGTDFVCSRSLIATALRLRSPAVSLPGAFPSADVAVEQSEPHELECVRDGATIVIRRRLTGQSLEASVRLTPGLGWSLLIPARLTSTSTLVRWPNAAWLLLLGFPLGFYGIFAWKLGGGRAESGTRALLRFPATALLGVLVAQVALPPLAGIAPSPWWEVTSSLAGVVLGAGAALLLVRIGSTREAGAVPGRASAAPPS